MCSSLYRYAHVVPCHRKADRSFHVRGVKMPMCSRCFGMMLGYVGIPLWYLVGTELPLLVGLMVTLLPATTLIVDGFTQKWKWRESRNWIRVITGFGSTFGLSYGVVWGVDKLIRFIMTFG